jgi:3',5'-cyclic-AMP phosphodiesterase
MLLCQISDLHIKPARRLAYGVVDTAGLLERCVEHIGRLPQAPDAVLATGDLVDLGRPEEYGLLRELLQPLRMPLFLLPGNHDERAALRAAFPEHRYLTEWEPFVQYVIEDFPLRLVGLDTVIPGRGNGELCGERLAWLDRRLSTKPGKPTLVAMHHPPFDSGIGHMDRVGLTGTGALTTVIKKHRQVERVVAGHVHRSISVRFAGTVASTCPSPAHQVALDLAAEAADQFVLEPPGYQLHWWSGRHLVTHTAVIGHFDGPYPFRADGRLID